ncbi:MAG: hypothetical protein WCA49_05065 [Candidatus Sulfotelmatobacter sp.]
MKVFLGWSGETSKKVALALHGWIPRVIQSVKPYISSEDIAKGARWAAEIAKELQTCNYGIICITDENADSPWINFEGGALSREIEKTYVTPFLFNLRPAEVQGPLALFQSVINEKDDILKLVESINGRQETEQRLERDVLRETFEMRWPKLKEELTKISREDTQTQSRPKRDLREILEELLERARMQQSEMGLRWDDNATRQKIQAQDQINRITQLTGLVTALARNVENLYTVTDRINAVLGPNAPRSLGSLLGPLPYEPSTNAFASLLGGKPPSEPRSPNLVGAKQDTAKSPDEKK